MKQIKSDGCSGGMSYVWNKLTGHGPPWEGCCVTHDRQYHAGGTRQDRKEVDKALRVCVSSGGNPIIAWIMYIAVRVGGGPRFPHKYRWGNGGAYFTQSLTRGYRQWGLSEKQQERVRSSRYSRLPK